MARKKKLKKMEVIDKYMDYYLEFGEAPKSVYQFAKANEFDEKDFYALFGSFQAIENHIFKAFFDQTIQLLNKSEEYQNFDARNKLLSFYYTFFEILTANRSFVLSILENGEASLKTLKILAELRKAFLEYIEELDIETPDLKQEKLEKIKKRSVEETSWTQLLITLNFWMNDSSAGFEKTDMFIEKSINTGFDLIDVKPLRSIIDLGKFLYNEKINVR
jgi:hypothetical protein